MWLPAHFYLINVYRFLSLFILSIALVDLYCLVFVDCPSVHHLCLGSLGHVPPKSQSLSYHCEKTRQRCDPRFDERRERMHGKALARRSYCVQESKRLRKLVRVNEPIIQGVIPGAHLYGLLLWCRWRKLWTSSNTQEAAVDPGFPLNIHLNVDKNMDGTSKNIYGSDFPPVPLINQTPLKRTPMGRPFSPVIRPLSKDLRLSGHGLLGLERRLEGAPRRLRRVLASLSPRLTASPLAPRATPGDSKSGRTAFLVVYLCKTPKKKGTQVPAKTDPSLRQGQRGFLIPPLCGPPRRSLFEGPGASREIDPPGIHERLARNPTTNRRAVRSPLSSGPKRLL